MDDSEWALFILAGLGFLGALGIAYLVVLGSQQQQPVSVKEEDFWEWTDQRGQVRTLSRHGYVTRNTTSTRHRVVKL